MAPQVLIRPLQAPGEAELCARLMAESDPWLTLRRGYNHAFTLLTDPTRESYVAIVDGAVVGFVVVNLVGPLRGYLQAIGVLPAWRSRGVGQELIAFAEERIFRECPNVFLLVSSFNLGAQRLYARLGYVQVGELKDYAIKGHSELLMRKTLGPLADFQPRARGDA